MQNLSGVFLFIAQVMHPVVYCKDEMRYMNEF